MDRNIEETVNLLHNPHKRVADEGVKWEARSLSDSSDSDLPLGVALESIDGGCQRLVNDLSLLVFED